MDINCNQFEGLLSFYLNNELSEKMTSAVEKHMEECPNCKMRYSVVNSIIEDIKSAYNEVIQDSEDYNDFIEAEYEIPDDEVKNTELSAYIDNELDEEHSVKLRRNIVAKPKLRNKIDKLYDLRRLISDSKKEQKNKLKTDYSKEIVKTMNNNISDRQVYMHCALFILFVVCVIALSLTAIINLL